MEKSCTIGEQRICSLELVQLPARQHACCKGGEPSHKSKMEDLTVEVCGENGAYYKVRSVKSIQKTGRKIEAVDRLTYGPWRGSNLTKETPVLRESAALKCSRGNAASSDAMSRLTGRDFRQLLMLRFVSMFSQFIKTHIFNIRIIKTPLSSVSRKYRGIMSECLTLLIIPVILVRMNLYALCFIFSGLCHRCL